MLFNPANLTYWIFLGIGVFFFLLVIISGGGGDEDIDVDTDVDLDIDIDADVDMDIDVDADMDIDADADVDADGDMDMDGDGDKDFTPFTILSWIGLGKTPLLILLALDFSTWGITGWILNTIVGGLTGSIPTGFLGGIIFVFSFILSVSIGSLISRPIGQVFAGFGEDASGDRLIGCVGTVTSKQIPYLIDGRIGQIDVLDQARNLVTIEVALPEWAKVIPHHRDKVLIIGRQKHSYIVISKDSSDEDKWLHSTKN